jgi:hypothetical protein
VRTRIYTGQPLISDQVLIAIIGGIFGIILAIPTLLSVRSNYRLGEARLRLDEQNAQLTNQASLLKSQGEEQGRLAATSTRLADEAKERSERYKEEREADRLAQREAAERLREAADYYQKRWEEEAAITNEQRAEIKGLVQQVIDAMKANDKLQREYSASDRAHSEDIERLKKKTEDYDKLHGQFDLMNNMLLSAQKTIGDQEKAIHTMNDKFDADFKTFDATNDETVKQLKSRVKALEAENDDLKQEIAKLRADLKLLTDAPHQPEPPPGNISPLPAPKTVDDLSEAA